MKPQRRILVIYYNYDSPGETRIAIDQHLKALEASSSNNKIFYYNAFKAPYWELDYNTPEDMPDEIKEKTFDAVILHNSFLWLRWAVGDYFFKIKNKFDWIRCIEAPKIAIPQDEGDHAGYLDEWLFDWGIQAIFSVHYHNSESPLYPLSRQQAKIYSCLPGYINKSFAEKIRPILTVTKKREKDIVYRATRLPYWFGSVGQMKHRIADVVNNKAQKLRLSCDISTRLEDVITGSKWIDFIASGKAIIGSEGGSSVLDWYGEVKTQIQAMLTTDPNLSFDQVSARMPPGWDSYRFVTLTPRHFEALITKTCQILVEGAYSGILDANKHYIPIKPDLSNLDDALSKIHEDSLVEEIVENAYHDILLSGKYYYDIFAQKIEMAIDELSSQKIRKKNKMTTKNENLFLERLLFSERHTVKLLQAKLQLAQAELEKKRAELDQTRAELDQTRAELELLGWILPSKYLRRKLKRILAFLFHLFRKN